MGITSDTLFENIYNILFSPKEFFEKEDLKISTRLAIFVVMFTGMLVKLSKDIFYGEVEGNFYLFGLIFSGLLAVFVWFITGLFFEYTAKIYDKDGNLSKILFFTAFASIPYILFPPLNILKDSCNIGYIAASSIEILLYARIIYLYACSLKTAYGITLARGFMLLFLPLVSLFFLIYWSVCIFSKVRYIFGL